MTHVSEVAGTLSQVRQRCIPQGSAVANGIVWQWHGDRRGSWHSYDADVINYIEDAHKEGRNTVDLSENFPHCNYEIQLHKMQQRNKRTKYQRPIRRITVTPFPVTKCTLQGVDEDNINCEALSAALDNVDCSTESDSCPDTSPTKRQGRKHLIQHITDLWNKLKKSADRDSDDASDKLVSSANKKQCASSKPGDELNTHDSSKASCDADMEVSTSSGSDMHAGEDSVHPIVCVPSGLPTTDMEDVLALHTEECTLLLKADEHKKCAICLDELRTASFFGNDRKVVKLQLCHHVFHNGCLKAMYENGSKDGSVQCPICKTVHGEKHGIQPPGTMDFHVICYSLPSYPHCNTIRIVYDIPPGVQGPEHPNPGSRYTARRFPRTCYLPDNDPGRHVLKLLTKAWERKLIFTIGTSATTGEENTVIWGGIPHKTNYSSNDNGYGFPDPSYFHNVIEELAAHGVVD